MTVLDHDWFSAPLPDNVRLGPESWMYSSFAFRHSRSVIGVSIGEGSAVYNPTFFNLGPDGSVEIGDHSLVVAAIFATNGRVVIGDHVLIAHDVVLADESAAVPGGAVGVDLPDPTISIGDDCWIGMGAVLLAGARLGRGVIVGADCVVSSDVPDYSIVAGNPARIVGRAG